MNAIELTIEEIDSWHRTIKDRLGDKYDHDLVNKKLDECAAGWDRAPKTFEQRIERKFFHKPPARKSPEPVKSLEVGDDPIFKYLNNSEIEFWKKRYKEYIEDFAFNSSSDTSLLRQLIFEEVIQDRCMRDRLDNKKDQVAVEEQLNNSVKRLTDLQRMLGINRDKRKDILDTQKGDLSSLAASLEEKIKLAKKEEDRNAQEEAFYLAKKSERPVVNILPPLESLSQEDGVIIDITTTEKEMQESQAKPDLSASGVRI